MLGIDVEHADDLGAPADRKRSHGARPDSLSLRLPYRHRRIAGNVVDDLVRPLQQGAPPWPSAVWRPWVECNVSGVDVALVIAMACLATQRGPVDGVEHAYPGEQKSGALDGGFADPREKQIPGRALGDRVIGVGQRRVEVALPPQRHQVELALGDVLDGGHKLRHGPVRAAQGFDIDRGVDDAAIAMQITLVHGVAIGLGAHDPIKFRNIGLQIVRMREFGPSLAQQFAARIAEHFAQPVVDVKPGLAFRGGQRQAEEWEFEQHVLALPQRTDVGQVDVAGFGAIRQVGG